MLQRIWAMPRSLQARGRGCLAQDGEAPRGDAGRAAAGCDAPVRYGHLEVVPTNGKTQYFTATSIDGFIADPDNSLDWLFQAHDESHGEDRWEAFIGNARRDGDGSDDLRMGRTSTRSCWRSWPTGSEWGNRDIRMLGRSHLVSYRRSPAPTFASSRATSKPVHKEMTAAADGKNIWLVGGGDLVGQFTDRGLLDELQLHVAPVTLGGLAPATPADHGATAFALRRAEMEGGFAYLTYDVAAEQ